MSKIIPYVVLSLIFSSCSSHTGPKRKEAMRSLANVKGALQVGVCRNKVDTVERIKYLKNTTEFATPEQIESAESKFVFVPGDVKLVSWIESSVYDQDCRCESIAYERDGTFVLDKKLYELLSEADRTELKSDIALGTELSPEVASKCRAGIHEYLR